MYQPTKETSKAAYHSIEKPTKKTLHDEIIKLLMIAGAQGKTAGWIGHDLKVPNSTIGARIVELEEAGKLFRIEKTGTNPSGRQANLIVANQFRGHYRHDEIAPPVKYNKGASGVVPIQNHKAEAMKAFIVEMEMALSQGRHILPNTDWHKRATALIS
jgi:hypothetical protein